MFVTDVLCGENVLKRSTDYCTSGSKMKSKKTVQFLQARFVSELDLSSERILQTTISFIGLARESRNRSSRQMGCKAVFKCKLKYKWSLLLEAKFSWVGTNEIIIIKNSSGRV